MSKTSSRRPAREVRKQRQKAQKKLREKRKSEGFEVFPSATLPNRVSSLSTAAEEKELRQDVAVEHFKILADQLPSLLERLSRIPDPRNPKKISHQLTMVMLLGILSFVFQMSSRREANRRMSLPMFRDNLKALLPNLDLESLPHQDTLKRLLENMEDVGEIEQAHLGLVERLIRMKRFKRYLVKNRYPIAIDGTQKWARSWSWSDEALERHVGSGEQKKSQFYVYVLEATLSLPNGMVIPLMSEFLAVSEGDLATSKQDCEQKAFQRLAQRLKKRFPRLAILVLLDGLYPNGPMMKLCRDYRWQFMIVLQDLSLPTVWEEFRGLHKLQSENHRQQLWGDRRQDFTWVNEIEYTYGSRQRLTLHVVVCDETWEEVGSSGETEKHSSRHAWVSSEPLKPKDLHQRCNLTARRRWGIEANILVEKHHGYCYEHCFAHDWNAMKGYHYLMHLGHLINILARYSLSLQETIRTLGVRGYLEFLRETVAGPWLEPEQVRARLSQPFQIRLI